MRVQVIGDGSIGATSVVITLDNPYEVAAIHTGLTLVNTYVRDARPYAKSMEDLLDRAVAGPVPFDEQITTVQ